jgi:uroporphyrinogen-III synthase
MRVLVTRPAAQAQAWVMRLRERGVDAHALPLIEIVDAQDLAPLRTAWATLSARALVFFVSPNAVQRFFAQRPPGAAWPAATRAAAPGPGTTQALAALGVPPAMIVEPAADAAQFDSEALWSRLSAQAWRDAPVLCVRGDGGRDWLVERLRSAGAQVECVSAYRRVAPVLDAGARQLLADALAQPARTLWWFSTSQAIDHLSALIEHEVDWSGARALVTHPRIATRARKLGFGHVDETRPASEDVLNAIERSIQSAAP